MRAIGFHKQALAISREIGDRRGEGTSLGNLGGAYYALGQVEQAIKFYEQALAIAQEIGDRRVEGITCWNLGLIYETSDPARAVELMSVRMDFEREIGHSDAGRCPAGGGDSGPHRAGLSMVNRLMPIPILRIALIGNRNGERGGRVLWIDESHEFVRWDSW